MNFLQNDIQVDYLIQNHRGFIKNNGILLRLQQRFKSEKHNAYSQEYNKISLSFNNDKRISIFH